MTKEQTTKKNESGWNEFTATNQTNYVKELEKILEKKRRRRRQMSIVI